MKLILGKITQNYEEWVNLSAERCAVNYRTYFSLSIAKTLTDCQCKHFQIEDWLPLTNSCRGSPKDDPRLVGNLDFYRWWLLLQMTDGHRQQAAAFLLTRSKQTGAKP